MEEEIILEEEQPKLWKKILKISLAIALIILIVSYVALSFGIKDIIASLLSSQTIKEYKVEIEENQYLIFEDDTYEELLKEYYKYEDREFKACLLGRIGKDYFVERIIIPKMTEQAFEHVTSESCPENTIVDLHSHPYRKCLASEQDFKSLEMLKSRNKGAIMAIMCENTRFGFYT